MVCITSAQPPQRADSQAVKQISLASSPFELRSKATRKRLFLAEMQRVVPWGELMALIAPCAPAVGLKGSTLLPITDQILNKSKILRRSH